MLGAPQIGVRHSRRLRGLRRVTRQQWDTGHGVGRRDRRLASLSPKFPNISVPYGALVPAELDGVLGAGRHVACDASSHTFLREIPQCWMTGQAAGVAAALAAAGSVRLRDLDAAGHPARAAAPGGVPLPVRGGGPARLHRRAVASPRSATGRSRPAAARADGRLAPVIAAPVSGTHGSHGILPGARRPGYDDSSGCTAGPRVASRSHGFPSDDQQNGRLTCVLRRHRWGASGTFMRAREEGRR